jgi:hypothetical protein
MDPPTSPLSHRAFPTIDDIIRHPWKEVLEQSQPKSINANALSFPDFLSSTSTWNQRHIIAFRMLDFSDVPLQYLYPHKFYPLDDDPVLARANALFTLSRDDVQKGKIDMRETGAAFSFYRTLQDCLRTEERTPSPTQVPVRPQRASHPQAPLHKQTYSDSSGSSYVASSASANLVIGNPSSEDKAETVTNILVINYLYLLPALESTATESSRNRNVLFRYVLFLFGLSQSVQTMVVLLL